MAPFDTPKPEGLLQRVIHLGSEPGDIVLDCFAGSGTTASVAHKTGRRWLAVERSPDTVASFTLPRLERVVAGDDPGGITTVETPTVAKLPDGVKAGEAKAAAKVLAVMAKAGALDDADEATVEALVKTLQAADKMRKNKLWSGGGGFRLLEVAPSMFEADEGLVFLAEGMTNGRLAEVAAAQLGFEYQPEPPFAGRKGRSRLAVVDGVVNSAVVELLVQALPEQERVIICGTGIDPDARAVLRSLRPGSTLRKIPAALLSEYRSGRAERLAAPTPVTAEAGA